MSHSTSWVLWKHVKVIPCTFPFRKQYNLWMYLIESLPSYLPLKYWFLVRVCNVSYRFYVPIATVASCWPYIGSFVTFQSRNPLHFIPAGHQKHIRTNNFTSLTYPFMGWVRLRPVTWFGVPTSSPYGKNAVSFQIWFTCLNDLTKGVLDALVFVCCFWSFTPWQEMLSLVNVVVLWE